MYLPYLWTGPLLIPVVMYLVYQEMGPAALTAVGVLVAVIPLQFLMGFFLTKIRYHLMKNSVCYIILFVLPTCRLQCAKLTDDRIKVLNEVISSIRVIKMYVWENTFKKVVEKIRRSVLCSLCVCCSELESICVALSHLQHSVDVLALVNAVDHYFKEIAFSGVEFG